MFSLCSPSFAVISHVSLTDCGSFLALVRENPACSHCSFVVLVFDTLFADTLLFTVEVDGSRKFEPKVLPGHFSENMALNGKVGIVVGADSLIQIVSY